MAVLSVPENPDRRGSTLLHMQKVPIKGFVPSATRQFTRSKYFYSTTLLWIFQSRTETKTRDMKTVYWQPRLWFCRWKDTCFPYSNFGGRNVHIVQLSGVQLCLVTDCQSLLLHRSHTGTAIDTDIHTVTAVACIIFQEKMYSHAHRNSFGVSRVVTDGRTEYFWQALGRRSDSNEPGLQ